MAKLKYLQSLATAPLMSRFARNRQGGVAIAFALVLVVLMAFVGVAVDYSGARQQREKMQTALDSAIVVAATTSGSNGAKTQAFNKAFGAQYPAVDPVMSASAQLDLSSASQLNASASGRIKTSLISMIGVRDMAIGVRSSAKVATGVEFALVLDVSGSMKYPDMSGSARIDVLKTAATNLVDTAVANAGPGANLKFGYVPFTMNVNIGTANAGYVDDTSNALFSGTQWAGCVMERAVPNHLSNAYSGSNKWRAYIYPPEPNSGGYCDNPSNGTNSGYNVIDAYIAGNPNPYTRGPNYNCVRHPVAPLTTSASSIKAQLATLTAENNMGTILAPGVSWGTRILTPNAPFSGADPIGGTTRKIMVMLTDGAQTTEMRYPNCNTDQNTATPYSYTPSTFGQTGRSIGPNGPRDFFGPYGYIYDSDPFGNNYTDYSQVDASLDPLALQACAFAKSQGIEIYSIAVSSYAGPGTSVYNTLKSCASDDDHFFYATDATTLTNTFADIARKATALVRTK